VAAREGAVNAKWDRLCQLRDVLITTQEPLRAELWPLAQRAFTVTAIDLTGNTTSRTVTYYVLGIFGFSRPWSPPAARCR